MVKLRLMRMGKKKQPTYRIVAADSRSPRDGRFIEIVGNYDPRQEPSVVNIESDKALVWLRKGAQPTETVRKLLEITGTWGEFKGGPAAAPAPAPSPVAVLTEEPSAQEAAEPEVEIEPEVEVAEVAVAEEPATEEPAEAEAEGES